jgi:hypothetical protein
MWADCDGDDALRQHADGGACEGNTFETVVAIPDDTRGRSHARSMALASS